MGLSPTRTTTLGLHRNEFLFAHGPHVLDAKRQPCILENYCSASTTQAFSRELSSFLGLDPKALTIGHGAEDLLLKLLTWYRSSCQDVLIPEFSWGEYERLTKGLGYRIWHAACHLPGQPMIGEHSKRTFGPCLDLEALASQLEAWKGHKIRPDNRIVVILPTTNNPTGTRIEHGQVAALIDAFPEAIFLLDAVYEPLPSSFFADFSSHSRVHVIGSMSKFFGLPGLRLGFSTGPCPEAFQLSLGFGQWQIQIARAAIQDSAHYAAARAALTASAQSLSRMQLSYTQIYPSAAPFILVCAGQTPVPPTAPQDMTEKAQELLRLCEDESGVWPKVFEQAGHLWFRFGLGADPIPDHIRSFLKVWDHNVSRIGLTHSAFDRAVR